MYKILIADPLDPSAVEKLRAGGAEVEILGDDRERLPSIIGDFDALVVRSGTQVTRELLGAATKLRVVGRAGVGVDNIDLQAATERGVLVVNSPTANLMSATEHTFALMLALARKVALADASLKDGQWDRKSYRGSELYGKTLGIIGFGKIGQKVAFRAHGFEMDVVAYDPFLQQEVADRASVRPVELDELLEVSDFITFHTPLTDQTRGMLNRERIARMKDGAFVINCGRGGVIDEEALLEALDSGKLGGAGIDVFPKEPPEDFTLAGHPRVLATPHIGASTSEAQDRIGTEISKMVLDALGGSLAVAAVNLPFRAAGPHGEPYLHLAERLGALAASLLQAPLERVELDFWGIDEDLRKPVTVAALKGALAPAVGEGVNFVNAERLATDRGIAVVRSQHSNPSDYAHLVSLRASSGDQHVDLSGTLYGDGDPRIVGINDFRLEFQPSGRLLVLRNRDVPGVVGKYGTILGEAEINIVDIHLARREGSDEALAVIRLDQPLPSSAREAFEALDEVHELRLVELG